MGIRVTYGCNEFLEMPDVGWIVSAEASGGRISPVVDVASLTESRLSSPLGLPPLRECITADDQIVLALRRGTPQGDQIAAATVKYLSSFLTPGQQIVILRTPADELAGRGDPREHLSESARHQVRVKTHRAEQAEELAYLARFESGQPLRLNRALVDADVVIPIGWVSAGTAWRGYGASGAVFPAFGDQSAQLVHFRTLASSAPGKKSQYKLQSKQRRSLASQANSLLGMQFAIQVVPGINGGVLTLFAGDLAATYRAARREYQKNWCPAVSARSQLVLAGVDANPSHSPWENLAQAAWAAARIVRKGGLIVLLTDWSYTEVGPPVRQESLAETVGAWSWADFLQRHGDSAVPFWMISRVRRQASICLWSPKPLRDETLSGWRDRLAIQTASGPEIVHRLVQSSDSCIVLPNATLAWPSVERHAEKRENNQGKHS